MSENAERIKSLLDDLRQQRAVADRVAIVIHFWQPFPNLSLDGFKFPQIPVAEIESRQPYFVSLRKESYVDSVFSDRAGRYVPIEKTYEVQVDQQLLDLTHRFGSYGLVEVAGLATTVDKAERYISLLSTVIADMANAPLQVWPDFLGIDHPVGFELPDNRQTTDLRYDAIVKELRSKDLITPQERKDLMAAKDSLAYAVTVACNVALMPGHGKLQRSILEVNSGEKSSFDGQDKWMMSQFPDFNFKSKLESRKSDNDITSLVKQFTDALTSKVQPSVESPDIQALIAAEVQKALAGSQPPAPDNSVVVVDDTDTNDEESEVEEQGPESEQIIEPKQCQKITQTTGKQCKMSAEEGGDYCRIHAVLIAENEKDS